jgi:hypothetical protein
MRIILKFFVTLPCITLMVWQSYVNIKIYFSYPTAQSVSFKNLLDAGFPKIEVCISPGFDTEYLKSVGYGSIYNFAEGKGKKNDKLFYGWKGDMDSGLELIFENAVNFKNFSSIVQYIGLFLDNKEAINGIKIAERNYKYPDGKCFDIKKTLTHK